MPGALPALAKGRCTLADTLLPVPMQPNSLRTLAASCSLRSGALRRCTRRSWALQCMLATADRPRNSSAPRCARLRHRVACCAGNAGTSVLQLLLRLAELPPDLRWYVSARLRLTTFADCALQLVNALLHSQLLELHFALFDACACLHRHQLSAFPCLLLYFCTSASLH
jgi:hypothetical protein